jgi:hypothetical protein
MARTKIPNRRTTSKAQSAPGVKAVSASEQSRFAPVGDFRLTVNIRQDLHLKLKIEAAQRRTTIGEIIEEMVDARYPK